MDIFAIHGVGGLVGDLLTGIFAADYVAHLDGSTVISGGWLNRHWMQVPYQLAASSAGFAYSFCGSILILFILNKIPGFKLRASQEEEILGIDDVEVGEFAYDYVESSRDVRASYGSSTHDSPQMAEGPRWQDEKERIQYEINEIFSRGEIA